MSYLNYLCFFIVSVYMHENLKNLRRVAAIFLPDNKTHLQIGCKTLCVRHLRAPRHATSLTRDTRKVMGTAIRAIFSQHVSPTSRIIQNHLDYAKLCANFTFYILYLMFNPTSIAICCRLNFISQNLLIMVQLYIIEIDYKG